MALVSEKAPNSPSSDYEAMAPYWDMVSTILGGTAAMRQAGEKYLPKLEHETQSDYDFRRKWAKFTNVFRDIVETLAAKLFAEEASVGGDSASERIKALAEDIDGQGNHIHVFAGQCFYRGIAYAIDWILVDYTKDVPAGATIAQERAIGVRPYWVALPAQRVLAAYSARIDGIEQFVHVRISEDITERDGYGERTIKQVRILNREPVVPDGVDEPTAWGPATYEVWRKEKDAAGREAWVLADAGDLSIGVIPLVPFVTGRRKGSSWQVMPPMQDAADLQIELYQQESGLKYAKEATAFPMLTGNGVDPDKDEKGRPKPIPIGPKAVLYAPPGGSNDAHGEWTFIEPSATSLKFLADDIKETIQQLRELGRQPLTAQTGNLTVVTTQFAAQKGNSAIQAWALGLKDAMENALRYTAMWLKEDQQAEFDLPGLKYLRQGGAEDKAPEILLDLWKGNGQEPGLSRMTLWDELRNRAILSPEFDPEEEEQRIIDEMPGDPSVDELSAALSYSGEEGENALIPPGEDQFMRDQGITLG